MWFEVVLPHDPRNRLLAATLIELLQDSGGAVAMGERARQVFDQQAGATDRCVVSIRELLSSTADQERTQ